MFQLNGGSGVGGGGEGRLRGPDPLHSPRSCQKRNKSRKKRMPVNQVYQKIILVVLNYPFLAFKVSSKSFHLEQAYQNFFLKYLCAFVVYCLYIMRLL